MALTRRSFLAGAAGAGLLVTEAHPATSWIDVHWHPIGGPQRQFREALDRSVSEMDARGISKAVVFPPPFANLNAATFDYSDYTPLLKRYPGRFAFLAGGGSLNPLLHQHRDGRVTPAVRKQFIDSANRILAAGAAGFGEMSALHLSLLPNHSFEDVSPEHPLLYALVEIAGAQRAVIDLHMDPVVGTDMPAPPGLKVPPNPARLRGNISGFERLLEHERNARIVWAHGGSDFTGNMTAALIGQLMDKHANLYMSLRPIPPMATTTPFGLRFHNQIIAPNGIVPEWQALLTRHADRFVMGSDAFLLGPAVNTATPSGMLGKGNEARFTAARQLLSLLPASVGQKIGAENAMRLYKL